MGEIIYFPFAVICFPFGRQPWNLIDSAVSPGRDRVFQRCRRKFGEFSGDAGETQRSAVFLLSLSRVRLRSCMHHPFIYLHIHSTSHSF